MRILHITLVALAVIAIIAALFVPFPTPQPSQHISKYDYPHPLAERVVSVAYAENLTWDLVAGGQKVWLCMGYARWCIREGGDYQSCSHAWVKYLNGTHLEATTGETISPEDYRRDYDERRCY